MMETSVSVKEREETKAKKTILARIAVTVLCVGLSAVATTPFFFIGREEPGKAGLSLRMPITHDMHLHFEQIKSFYTGISSGEIYPRWEEDTNRGFGAPTGSYYPPGFYYLTSALYPILGDWIYVLLAAHLIVMVAAASAIYLYARRVMSRFAAAVAMVAYIFLPYHLLDQYQRAALAELLSFVWMPLLMLFGERLFRERVVVEEEAGATVPAQGQSLTTRRAMLNVAGLALSYSAFLWSHPPTAYQFTLAFGIFALLLTWRRRDLKGLFLVGAGMALGIGLTSAYLYPAAVEQDLIRHDYISSTWPYHVTYVFLHALPYLHESHLGFFRLVDGIWVFNTAAIVAGAIGLLAFRPRALRFAPGLKERVLLWVVMGGFAAFMMLEVSKYIGQYIPKIDIGVFTWRMLSITTLIAALLAGAFAEAVIHAFRQRRTLEWVAFAALAMLITLGGAAFSGVAVVGSMLWAPEFVPSLEHVNFATIPATSSSYPDELPVVERAELAAGAGTISIENWQPEHRALTVDLQASDTLIIRTFNFPGWTATVDGRPVEIRTWHRAGEIAIDLPPGNHHVRLDFLDTPPRRLGSRVTIIAFLVVMAMLLTPLVGRKLNRAEGDQTKGENE
ncbi:MAG TPA: hypothetical protein VNO70_06020 [Blastocatellia bacterium]|nr:hypothetical protein [Blastocatellia bacterium]